MRRESGWIFFVYQVEARVGANAQKHITRQETRWGGRGKHKIVGNKDNRISVKGRGTEWGTRGEQYGTTGTFRKGKQGI